MRDTELYRQLLGVQSPWKVVEVDLRVESSEIEVLIQHDGSDVFCKTCGEKVSRYDTRKRSWRHLDSCQFKTILTAEIPRANCKTHGVHQLDVPWAEPGSRFTAMFERLAIDWIREASFSAVGRLLNLSFDELDGIQSRAVARGLARRKEFHSEVVCIDETSFQKRHEYVTIVLDGKTNNVLYVADDRKETSLEPFFKELTDEQKEGLRAISMDMWKPYIQVAERLVPNAEEKICFDRFHVAKHIGEAVDKVRKAEHRELAAAGDKRLARTKYLWLNGKKGRKKMSHAQRSTFAELRTSTLRVARAWAMKELASNLWRYVSRGWATKAWKKWITWANRSRLKPMQAAAKMVNQHLWGILNAILQNVTNAPSESINAKVQKLKQRACGYRNRSRFRTAILFHCGGLDLYPMTHSIS